jgi:dihydrofolate reductase
VRTSLIVAADEADVIGVAGGLPWHLPDDLRRFKRLTLGHAVVAGRRTHESILVRIRRPLPGRFTVVVTRRSHPGHGSVVFQPDVASALDVARGIEEFAGREEVFVIGGAEVYAQTLDEVDRVYLTRVHQRTGGDAAMPSGWLTPFSLVEREDHAPDGQFSFLTYERG